MVDKNKTNRSQIAWWILGSWLAIVLVFVLYEFIGTFVVGLFIYYVSKPVYSKLNKDIKSSELSAFVSLVIVVLPILLIMGHTLAIGVQEVSKLIQQYQLETWAQILSPYVEIAAIAIPMEQLLSGGRVMGAIIGNVDRVTSYIAMIGSVMLHMFLALSIAFYLLVDGPQLSKWVMKNVVNENGMFREYMKKVDRSFHQIFVGNILNVLITASIGIIVYTIISFWIGDSSAKIPYPAVLGILAGVASLIPIVGMKIIYVPTTLYLLLQGILSGGPNSLLLPIVFLIVSFLIVDCIPDLVIRPYISGKNLHTGVIMFSYIFGPLMFGWYGIFLGPMIAILIFHFGGTILPNIMEMGFRGNKNKP